MNTYAEAAVKLGCKKSYVKRLAQNRKIEVFTLGHRTKLISDGAIEKFKREHTRGAL